MHAFGHPCRIDPLLRLCEWWGLPMVEDAAESLGVPVYTFNIGGYQIGHSASGEGRLYTLGGLNDQGFRVMDLIERGVDASWPWLSKQG
jgi:hypothetical protein